MRGGFTLTELMVVLLVMGIVAGAVTLSLAGPKRRAELDDVVGEVVQFDLLARQYAARHGRAVQLVFDMDAGRVLRTEKGAVRERRPAVYVPPEGYRLGELRLAGKRLAGGRAALWCSVRGYTATYAVRVDGPSGRRWVLFAGLTGEASVFEDEKELEQTLSLLSGSRPDAD